MAYTRTLQLPEQENPANHGQGQGHEQGRGQGQDQQALGHRGVPCGPGWATTTNPGGRHRGTPRGCPGLDERQGPGGGVVGAPPRQL